MPSILCLASQLFKHLCKQFPVLNSLCLNVKVVSVFDEPLTDKFRLGYSTEPRTQRTHSRKYLVGSSHNCHTTIYLTCSLSPLASQTSPLISRTTQPEHYLTDTSFQMFQRGTRLKYVKVTTHDQVPPDFILLSSFSE